MRQISLRQPKRQRERLAQYLHADEQERAARFHFERDREAYETARGTLRLVLAGYCQIEPTAVPIAYAERGKPYLAAPYSQLKFNLSHAGDWALLAVSDGRELGVDVEKIRPLPELEQIAERFFAPIEREALLALPAEQRLTAFFTCWTRKEAYIKALGDGLRQPLDEFAVTVRPDEPARLLYVLGEETAVNHWEMREIAMPPGYVAALVVARGG